MIPVRQIREVIMLGEFVTWSLVLLLGYVYPAFECFRAIERKEPKVEQLLFWCRYCQCFDPDSTPTEQISSIGLWVIMGLLTALERFGDMFVSWLPMYGEVKLAFVIYLWHPKTEGARHIYREFFFPWLAKHEPHINRKLQEARAKSGDLILFYVKNFTEKGQSLAFDALQYVIRRASGASHSQLSRENEAPPPPLPDQGQGARSGEGSMAMERILRDAPINFLWSGRRRRRD